MKHAVTKRQGGRLSTVQARLRRLKKDTAYFEVHHKDLLQRYPEQWVAVYNEKVVGVSEDGRQLLVDLKDKGVPPGSAVVKFLTNKEQVFILPA